MLEQFPTRNESGAHVLPKENEMHEFPSNGRMISLVLLASGAFLLLINHFVGAGNGSVYLVPLFLGPMALFLGLGGVIEPKLLWSLGKFGQHLPWTYKVVGGGLQRRACCCHFCLPSSSIKCFSR